MAKKTALLRGINDRQLADALTSHKHGIELTLNALPKVARAATWAFRLALVGALVAVVALGLAIAALVVG